MGAGHSKLPIKDRLRQASRHPLARVKRGTDSEPQQPEKLEVTVTRTITQETAPIIRAPSPLAPAEIDLAVALGIPAERMLNENYSGTDEFMLKQAFSNAIEVSRLNIPESPRSHHMQSPLEVSPMSDQSAIQPLANQLGNIPWLELTSENIADVSPISGQNTIQPLANQLGNIPSLDLTSEHIAEVSRYESDPNVCHFCKVIYSDDEEPKVYLPCGHSFGMICLYKWITMGLSIVVFKTLSEAHVRCPHDCIGLRYRCGHLVTPCASAPYPLHTDVSAIAIPSVYEFCRKKRGSTLSRDIKRLQSIEKALMGDPAYLLHRGMQRKILDVLSFRRPPFSKKLLSMVAKSRLKAESELYLEHKTWWLNEWARGGYANVEDSLFNTHHPWEGEMRERFLRDLELLE